MAGKRGRGGVTRFRGRWRARLHVDGAEKALGIFETEEEAREAVDVARAALAPELMGPRVMSLATYGLDWLDRRERSGRVRSVDSDRSVWRTHVAQAPFAQVDLRSLTRPMIVRWVNDLLSNGTRANAKRCKVNGQWTTVVESTREPLDRGTVVHALQVLRTCLREAADEGRLDRNVAIDVKVPRGIAHEDSAKEKWTWLREHEIATVLDPRWESKPSQKGLARGAALPPHVPESARLLWTVAIYTGLRKGELAGLRWQDVRLHDGAPYIRVEKSYRSTTKNGRGREVPLLPPALDAIHRLLEIRPGIRVALVWPSPSGGPFNRGAWSFGDWRKRSSKLLDRHVRIHDLRHTCASMLVQGAWGFRLSLYEVAQWLGHSSIGVTQRYAHLAPEGLRGRVAAANFIEKKFDDAEVLSLAGRNRHSTGTPAHPKHR